MENQSNFHPLPRRKYPSKNNHLSSVPLANPSVPEASPPGIRPGTAVLRLSTSGMELGTSVLAIGTRGMESGTSVLTFSTPGMMSGTAVLRKSPSGMKPGTVENHNESSGLFKGLWHKALVWVLNQMHLQQKSRHINLIDYSDNNFQGTSLVSDNPKRHGYVFEDKILPDSRINSSEVPDYFDRIYDTAIPFSDI